MVEKALGPPGTGKTTYIADRTAELVCLDEVNPSNIYATSLTKATKWALLDKMHSKGIELNSSQVRTLHSYCYQALRKIRGGKPYILTAEDIGEFFKLKGFEFRTDEAQSYSEDEEYIKSDYADTEGNKLFQAFNRIRLTLHPPEVIFGELDIPIGLKSFKALFEDYTAFLKKRDVFDFARLLLEAMVKDVRLEGDLLILDEFQDFGNLHVEIIKRWMPNFKHVLICGDDDQAIFTFAGSNPEHIIKLRADRTHVLPRSYRLPEKIYKVAQRVISANRNRVKKHFMPDERHGLVDTLYSMEDALHYIVGQSFILCRTNFFVNQWKALLEEHGIPYKVIGQKWQIPKIAKALRALDKLKRGEDAGEDFGVLLEMLKPYIRQVLGKKQIRSKLLEKIGAKVLYKNFTGEEGKVAYMVLTQPVSTLFPSEDESILKKWLSRIKNLDAWRNPRISIGTIHSAKGLEADTIFLDTRITRRVLNSYMTDPEAEHRVLYVGITRAKSNLFIVRPKGGYNYEHLGVAI